MINEKAAPKSGQVVRLLPTAASKTKPDAGAAAIIATVGRTVAATAQLRYPLMRLMGTFMSRYLTKASVFPTASRSINPVPAWDSR